ncbi:putative HTH-type transcriptional regulator YusO [Sporotomaculum syntrophicum]|uniref:HTH-type transcriptional regulator YusO n=1 Tax=Sporotomaculum syntrophicum TaxID=182264 RepID=A0A9D3AWA0_9FIRM|nr:MarR family transcriptional regulator [Sporotomaculum syntrophicum]KAF1085165.1 putative HTH-type transcriptional regulator YusO [Sporotomaculum syntrophicum]
MIRLENISEFDTLLQELVKANTCRLKGLFNGQVTQTQFFLLKLMAAHEHCKAADIAHILDISPSAATTIIDRLFKNGWIKRERSDQDRRIVWLKLTEQGKKLLSDIEARRLQLLMRQFEHLTEEEVIAACQVLKKILTGAEK